VVVAQAGKSFHSKKDPNSTNSYADQIDMRGVWIDKLLAAKYLLNRQIGIFTMDDNTDNFLNIDELREPLQQVFVSLMTNNVVDTVPFTLKDGSQAALEINYDVFATHVIDQPIVPFLSWGFGLPAGRAVQFQEKLASRFAHQMNDQSGAHDEDADLALAFSVSRYKTNSVVDPKAKSAVISGTKYVVDDTNVLASNAIDSLAISQVLDQLDPKKIAEILKAKQANQLTAPQDATATEKAAWAMSADTLNAYLNGVIKDSNFYIRLLNILPSA
jgi:hypothetical protein